MHDDVSLEGREAKSQGGIVPIGGKLPHYLEIRTGVLLDCLQALIPNAGGSKNRKKLGASLASRTRLGMYLQLNEHLHLAYADQRDGRNSQHWWRLFFDDSIRSQVETAARSTALAVGTGERQEYGDRPTSGSPSMPWSGMYFRSKAEIQIAQALHKRGVLFFANSQGLAPLQGLPITLNSHGLVERVEVDFLVFHQGRCIALEVDGRQHNQTDYALRDYARERVLLRERIPTVRFPAQDCLQRPDDVVEEFINIFPTL